MAAAPLVILTVLAAVVRFATLDAQSFWYDEALTVEIVNHSFGGMLGRVFEDQAQPPPYFILAWLWAHAFGDGEVGLRSLSALLGTATVPVAYLAGQIVGGRRVAIAVGLLTALSPPLIWYAQEARGYALLTFLSALSLLFFLRALERPTRRDLGLWALASVLAVASHYFALALVVPQAAWVLWRGVDRRVALPYVGGLGLGLVLIAPMLLYQREHGQAEWIGDLQLRPRVREVLVFDVAGPLLPRPLEDHRGTIATAVLVLGLLAIAAGVRVDARAGASSLPRRGRGGGGRHPHPARRGARRDRLRPRPQPPARLGPARHRGRHRAPRRCRVRALGWAAVGATCLWFAAIGYAVPTRDWMQRDDWRERGRAARAARGGPHRRGRARVAGRDAAPGLRRPGWSRWRAPRRVSRIVTITYDGVRPVQPAGQPGPPAARVPRGALAARRRDHRDRVRRARAGPHPAGALSGAGKNGARPFFEPGPQPPTS